MSKEKTERNKLIVQYHKEHPDKSLSDIGKLFRISKQAVSKILGRDK